MLSHRGGMGGENLQMGGEYFCGDSPPIPPLWDGGEIPSGGWGWNPIRRNKCQMGNSRGGTLTQMGGEWFFPYGGGIQVLRTQWGGTKSPRGGLPPHPPPMGETLTFLSGASNFICCETLWLPLCGGIKYEAIRRQTILVFILERRWVFLKKRPAGITHMCGRSQTDL